MQPPADLRIVPATPEQQPVLANLLELYAHDFSEFMDLELGADGRFGYRNLPLYWVDPNRYPFLVMVDGKLAGFVLVKRGSEVSGNESVWDLQEFFVARGSRRRGVGGAIARQVWRRFPGLWEVRVMKANHGAHSFWEHAVSGFVGGAVPAVSLEKNGQCWRVFSFESKP